ncbi:hypothetical protein F5148DRAFT_1020 [Russula earlei]|uniref:Uncharacterized protein n=1 Tax=Russula earlei TaxID=71964 RepID=A0ACC0UNV0_9AGAM|nr:hypothetical protein F5148DRAFT_1020 [Russula earlei]
MMASLLAQDPTMPNDERTVKDGTSASARIPSRHEEFYFTDEMTVFQVENRLFRVHRHFLAENSLVFSSMFSLPRGPEASSAAEGASDAKPIHLAGVTELEFETLLRYFYKSMHDGFSLPQTSWIALLSISHRYEFLNVRERAIREIYGLLLHQQDPLRQSLPQPPQDHVLLISVAEKYDVPPQYMIPSLVALVMRAQPLTEDEVARLSALNVSRLAQARENYVRRTIIPPQTQAGRLNTPNSWFLWAHSVAKGIVCNIWPVQEHAPAGSPSGSPVVLPIVI